MAATSDASVEARRCSGSTNERFPQRCHRDAVEEVEGRWFCRAHAVGARRRKANAVKMNAEIRAETIRSADIEAQAKRLSSKLGTNVRAEWSSRSFRCTGQMVVSAEFLESLTVKP